MIKYTFLLQDSTCRFDMEKLESYNWNYLDFYVCTRGEVKEVKKLISGLSHTERLLFIVLYPVFYEYKSVHHNIQKKVLLASPSVSRS